MESDEPVKRRDAGLVPQSLRLAGAADGNRRESRRDEHGRCQHRDEGAEADDRATL